MSDGVDFANEHPRSVETDHVLCICRRIIRQPLHEDVTSTKRAEADALSEGIEGGLLDRFEDHLVANLW